MLESLRSASRHLTVAQLIDLVIRTCGIENVYAGLAPRERTQPTDHSLRARAGGGGALLSFTVGDGTLRITQKSEGRKQ